MRPDAATAMRRPDYRRLPGNPDPLAVFRALYDGEPYAFLYESLEERGGRGRYSFLGGLPRAVLRARDDLVEVAREGGSERRRVDPFRALRELVFDGSEALPIASFPGGAVGYVAYDAVRRFAPVPDRNPDTTGLPDVWMMVPDEILVVDHLDETVHVVRYGARGGDARGRRIEDAVAATSLPPPAPAPGAAPPSPPAGLHATMDEPAFADAVRAAGRHIRAGDAFQVVLSRRFEFELPAPPLDVYAALRRANPSPYMYHLVLDGTTLCGSSPEVLATLSGRRVTARPLAGTRPRGRTGAEDRALAAELLADEKERAEHVMLIDLARNDIGRVCRAGSIRVERRLAVERYSRVMHLVSDVSGRLRDDRDALDLLAATFPAGTVSGAPKVRAMQIIDDLEPVRRGPYAGAIGYVSHLGDLDMCIAIRTIVASGGRGWLQAGAGIVADSDPGREFRETEAKARALFHALADSGTGGSL